MKWTVVDIGTRARTQLLEPSRTSLLPNCSRPKLSPASFGIKTHDYKPLEVPDNTCCRLCGSSWTHYVEKLTVERKSLGRRTCGSLTLSASAVTLQRSGRPRSRPPFCPGPVTSPGWSGWHHRNSGGRSAGSMQHGCRISGKPMRTDGSLSPGRCSSWKGGSDNGILSSDGGIPQNGTR